MSESDTQQAWVSFMMGGSWPCSEAAASDTTGPTTQTVSCSVVELEDEPQSDAESVDELDFDSEGEDDDFAQDVALFAGTDLRRLFCGLAGSRRRDDGLDDEGDLSPRPALPFVACDIVFPAMASSPPLRAANDQPDESYDDNALDDRPLT